MRCMWLQSLHPTCTSHCDWSYIQVVFFFNVHKKLVFNYHIIKLVSFWFMNRHIVNRWHRQQWQPHQVEWQKQSLFSTHQNCKASWKHLSCYLWESSRTKAKKKYLLLKWNAFKTNHLFKSIHNCISANSKRVLANWLSLYWSHPWWNWRIKKDDVLFWIVVCHHGLAPLMVILIIAMFICTHFES